MRDSNSYEFNWIPIESSPKHSVPGPIPVLSWDSESPLPQTQNEQMPVLAADDPDRIGGGTKSKNPEDTRQSWEVKTSRGPVWIQGDSILCACPDCQAPMSVRLWLLLAECWSCGTRIELDEELLSAVEQLVAKQEQSRTSQARKKVATPAPANGNKARAIENGAKTNGASSSTVVPRPRPSAAPPNESNARRRTRRDGNSPVSPHHRLLHQRELRSKRSRFRMTPAWLVSLILHFVLILLLALLAISDYVEIETLTLSSFASTEDNTGGIKVDAMDGEEMQFELPVPSDVDLDDRREREKLEEAQEAAKEIREDQESDTELPQLDLVRDRITADVDNRSHFIARDPRFRVEMVQREGGTTMTEAAVARGLAWLARFQNQDGSWSLDDYERSHRANNEGDAAATALALLPFLGAGQTHEYGRYKETVAKGLLWMLENQKPNGDLRAGMESQLGMYAHGQATIVMVEALAVSGDERFRDPAQRAINFIVKAQHEEGGWRYRPGQEGDTSVLGWQLMALQSARSPGLGLEVPDTALDLANYYLDLAGSAEGALYAYQPKDRKSPTETMTAEALLCRMYLGWSHDDPRLEAGLKWVAKQKRPSTRDKNIYYWYYATQAFHNYGGPLWEEWNEDVRETLVDLQSTRGKHAGSWDPSGFAYGSIGDRVYVTALAICTLEVYYRHLPIFRQIEIEPAQNSGRP